MVARDESDDTLEFLWVLSTSGPLGSAAPIPGVDETSSGSQIDLPREAEYDGQELSCTVLDSRSQETIAWLLEVPE